MKRRKISIFIISVLVLSMLLSTGCVKTQTPGSTSPADTKSTSPADTKSTSSADTSAKQTEDTQSPSEESKPLTNKERFEAVRGTTVTIIGSEPGTDASQDELIKYAEENYGLKVNVYVGKDDVETVTKLIAAGTPPDVVNLTNDRLFTYIQAAALLPLEELMDVNDPLFNQPLIDTCRWRGHVFGVNGDPLVKGYIVNKTMFENNGLETPWSLYEKGKWDWNAFRDACIALTQDTNGDGEIDVWGADLSMGDITIFPQANGANWLIIDKNEPKVTFGLDDPRAIEALQFVQECVLKYGCLTTSVKKQEWPNGKLAMVYESYGAIKKWVEAGLSGNLFLSRKLQTAPAVLCPEPLEDGVFREEPRTLWEERLSYMQELNTMLRVQDSRNCMIQRYGMSSRDLEELNSFPTTNLLNPTLTMQQLKLLKLIS